METERLNRIVRRVVVALAVALPLLPVSVWAHSALPIYRSMWHGPMLLLYLPARMLGLVGFVMMFYQFVMAARLPLIERAFTRAVIYRRHRTLGKIGFLLILAHGTAMLGFDLIMAGELLLDRSKTFGVIALALLTVAVAAAIFWKPLKLSNKQWMRIHRLAWVAFPLAFYHAVTIGTTINTSTAVLGLFYAMGAIYLLLLARRLKTTLRPRRRPDPRRRPATIAADP